MYEHTLIIRYIMKRLLTGLALMAFVLGMSAENKSLKLTVSNESGVDKINEPVVLRLKDVKKLKFNVADATVKQSGTDEALPVQVDDMDGDYKADELVFLADFKAHERKTFEVELHDKAVNALPGNDNNRLYVALQFRDRKDRWPDLTRVEAPGKTNIFNDIYMHGITLENEYVGFRIYFDERQNIDLYGKKKQRIELPLTQFYTTQEQLDEGYGTDVLWAGKAIGCGSFKRFYDGEPENWLSDAVGTRGQRIVTKGPIRTVIEVYDLGIAQKPEKDDGGTASEYLDVHQYYTLYAGRRDMRIDVRYNTKPITRERQFCTGVQKVGVTADDSVRMGHTPAGILRDDGIAASWGCDYPDMGKKQLWAPEPIGMAVYVPEQYIRGSKETELDYLYIVEPKDRELHYWLSFCCDKEEHDSYHSSTEWFNSMNSWKASLDNPVRIELR